MYSIEEIQQITNGKWVQHRHPGDSIVHFIYDSRQPIHKTGGIFIAFKGTNHDGHHFMHEAYAKGIRNFLISDTSCPSPSNANVLFVEDTLAALHQLASHHRGQFLHIPVIGITGSTGKTTVKEWLYEMLTPEMRVVKSPRSFNSSLGVPLSILRMDAHHELGIFEAGPAGPGQMAPLADLIRCNIGIMTNIGDAHSAQYPGLQSKIIEKLRLFEKAETLIYCRDHTIIARQIDRLFTGVSYCWSRKPGSPVRLHSTKRNPYGQTILEIEHAGQSQPYILQSGDAASIQNAMHVITTLLFLGFSEEYIRTKLLYLPQIQMRLELKAGIHRCLVLNDSYSADWDSFQLALNFLTQQANKPKRSLIVTDFVASEDREGELYKKMSEAINASGIHRVIAIGPNVASIASHLKSEISLSTFPDTRSLQNTMETDLVFENEAILLKGARKFHLESIAERLIERTHNTVLEINMYALAKNLKVYTNLLSGDTKVMVMVKANAYGAGSVEISRMLEYHGVDYLAVAYADEAILLRNNGITTKIMVLNPEVPQFDNYLRYDIEPEISSLRLLDKWIEFCKRAEGRPGFHLKVETGMHRLGFDRDAMPDLLERLKQHPELNIRSVFSHLAASGEAEHDAYTALQFKTFEEAYERIVSALGYRPMRHILNSAGIIRFPGHHYEMVRLGAGLYGIDSYLPFRDKINTVLAFKSRISQIKRILKGQSVGYSRGFIASHDMRIATISVGYGDGVPRALSNGKYAFLIHGQRAPILGSIAMDMCMVDITHIPQAREEDEVEIFGQQLPVQSMAHAAGTISYEIITSISGRVKRIYYY